MVNIEIATKENIEELMSSRLEMLKVVNKGVVRTSYYKHSRSDKAKRNHSCEYQRL